MNTEVNSSAGSPPPNGTTTNSALVDTRKRALLFVKSHLGEIITLAFLSPVIVPVFMLLIPFIAGAAVSAYAISWLAYLRYAQKDNPNRRQFLGFTLPYLPLSPRRVYLISRAIFGQIRFYAFGPVLPIAVRWTMSKMMQKRRHSKTTAVVTVPGSGGSESKKVDHQQTVWEDIRYGSSNPKNTLDVYASSHKSASRTNTRTSSSSSTLRPVIVFIYGGSWSSGDKSIYAPMATTFQSAGYVVVVVNYTLYPHGKVADMIQDVHKATRWTHENIRSYGGDPSNIYLMGHSAGAHLCALTVIHDAVSSISSVKASKPSNGTPSKTPVANGNFNKATANGIHDQILPLFETNISFVKGLILLAGVYDIAEHYVFESGRGVEEVSAMARVMVLRGDSSHTENGTKVKGVNGRAVNGGDKTVATFGEGVVENVRLTRYEGVDHSRPVVELMIPESEYTTRFLKDLEEFLGSNKTR
ncbi:hypothetical protein HK102_001103 [Quaeritorhiza haematococci]|nr:hypothetical protein HK102_001103 [Quaeritorhiza haematococci]